MGCTVATTLVVAVTACSSGGSGKASAAAATTANDTSSSAPTTPPASTNTPTNPPSTTESAASTSASVPTAPPTSVPSTSASLSQTSGAYLKTLLPVSGTEALLSLGPTLPPGWTAATARELDSGPTPKPPAPSLIDGDDCTYLVKQSPTLDLAEGLSVANASEGLTSTTTSASLIIYAYAPGDAAKSLAQVRQNLASTCNGFTAMLNTGAVHVDVAATPVSNLGDEALLVKITPDGPYVDAENLVVRHGNVTLSLFANNELAPLPDLSPVAAALIGGMG
ncbi:hypothetical protein Caci_3512 [Catenulispora acidiphila DSM 44928]|uniref:PknH-like extracellular domain-containing protein n=2 Tax=Catenulispora TaxID=414878 RepID=C7QAB9_CATAD|nr:hypothetical protein Caci_3512 [Catenulispora acidiphila DSM 44928]